MTFTPRGMVAVVVAPAVAVTAAAVVAVVSLIPITPQPPVRPGLPISSPSDVDCPGTQTWITYAIQGDPSRGDYGDGECGLLYEDGAYVIEGVPGCLPAWPCDNNDKH